MNPNPSFLQEVMLCKRESSETLEDPSINSLQSNDWLYFTLYPKENCADFARGSEQGQINVHKKGNVKKIKSNEFQNIFNELCYIENFPHFYEITQTDLDSMILKKELPFNVETKQPLCDLTEIKFLYEFLEKTIEIPANKTETTFFGIFLKCSPCFILKKEFSKAIKIILDILFPEVSPFLMIVYQQTIDSYPEKRPLLDDVKMETCCCVLYKKLLDADNFNFNENFITAWRHFIPDIPANKCQGYMDCKFLKSYMDAVHYITNSGKKNKLCDPKIYVKQYKNQCDFIQRVYIKNLKAKLSKNKFFEFYLPSKNCNNFLLEMMGKVVPPKVKNIVEYVIHMTQKADEIKFHVKKKMPIIKKASISSQSFSDYFLKLFHTIPDEIDSIIESNLILKKSKAFSGGMSSTLNDINKWGSSVNKFILDDTFGTALNSWFYSNVFKPFKENGYKNRKTLILIGNKNIYLNSFINIFGFYNNTITSQNEWQFLWYEYQPSKSEKNFSAFLISSKNSRQEEINPTVAKNMNLPCVVSIESMSSSSLSTNSQSLDHNSLIVNMNPEAKKDNNLVLYYPIQHGENIWLKVFGDRFNIVRNTIEMHLKDFVDVQKNILNLMDHIASRLLQHALIKNWMEKWTSNSDSALLLKSELVNHFGLQV